MNPINLNICQDCKVNPATYGDGLTWARCSECQYKYDLVNKSKDEVPVEETLTGDVFHHKTVEGLVSIIMPIYLVNYSLFHYTGNAIGSIREHTSEGSYELIIVDNGSPIKPPNMQAYYAEKVIVNEKNIGVTKAWNQGIRASFGEYIVLMNNDVQVFEGWLEDMKQALEFVDLVMATPMYSNTEPFARAVESRKLRGKSLNLPIQESLNTFKDFSCVMFKKSLIDELGLFDEDFFSYASDSEFMKRMEQNGKKYASSKRVPTSHISDATGYSIPETPDIMNKDKEVYAEKVKQTPTPPPSPTPLEVSPHSLENGPKLIRSNITGDKVFLVDAENTIHWIKSLEVLKALGLNLGQEKSVTKEEFNKYIKGEEINMQNYGKYKI